jgi:hypothetical protein
MVDIVTGCNVSGSMFKGVRFHSWIFSMHVLGEIIVRQ